MMSSGGKKIVALRRSNRPRNAAQIESSLTAGRAFPRLAASGKVPIVPHRKRQKAGSVLVIYSMGSKTPRSCARAVLPCLILLAGCALQQPSEAQKTMIGMSKEAVRGCMGAPEISAVSGNAETWTYASPNRGKSGGQCKADLVMTGGRVSRIDYRGDTGDQVTKGGVCGFIVEKCARP
jgi:hypothetical protein